MKTVKFLHGVFFAAIIGVMISGNNLPAQQVTNEKEYIKLEVDGLACPFCAYGLEKKLREKIEEIEALDINIEEGYVTFGYPKASKPGEDELVKIVEEAGFKADKISFSAEPFPKEDEK